MNSPSFRCTPFPVTAPSPIPIGTIDRFGRVWDGITWRCPVGIPEAPSDGQLYGRQNQTWQAAVASVNGNASNLSVDFLNVGQINVGTLNTSNVGNTNFNGVVFFNAGASVTAGVFNVDSDISSTGLITAGSALMVYPLDPGGGPPAPYSFGFWGAFDNMEFGYGTTGGFPNNGMMTLTTAGNLTLQGSLIQGSDARSKRNIDSHAHGLEIIEALTPKRYHRNKSERVELGFVAQEVQRVLPDAVVEHPRFGLGIDVMAIVSVLVNAVNELADEVDELRRGGKAKAEDHPAGEHHAISAKPHRKK